MRQLAPALWLPIMTAAYAQLSNSIAPLRAVQNACEHLINSPAHATVLQTLPSLAKTVQNPDLKAAIIATYAMGMFYSGQGEAANSAIRYLRQTFPASPYVALLDSTQYLTDCPRCSGSGSVKQPCQTCAGKGFCHGCGGRGWRERVIGWAVCRFCKGSGRCHDCSGSGEVTAKCPRCLGSGQIMAGNLLKDAYTKLLEKTKAAAYAEEQTLKGFVQYDSGWMASSEQQLEVSRESERRDMERLALSLRRNQDTDDRVLEYEMQPDRVQEPDRQRQIEEHAERKAFADKLFRGIKLTPTLGRTLAAAGAKIEIRGKNWNKILELYEARDWLALINLLLNQADKEYPDKSTIERAVGVLKYCDLFVLCRTHLRNEEGRQLILLKFGTDRNRFTVGSDWDWEAHPDGIGFTHRWSLDCGEAVILYGDPWQIRDRAIEFEKSFRQSKEYLDDKLKLGEISDGTYADRLRELIRRLHNEAVTWAQQQ